MYGELMQIETLVERIAELKEANRRLQTLNAELRNRLEYTRMINKKQRALIGRMRRANNERVLVH